MKRLTIRISNEAYFWVRSNNGEYGDGKNYSLTIENIVLKHKKRVLGKRVECKKNEEREMSLY